jgi:hypothetical protein
MDGFNDNKPEYLLNSGKFLAQMGLYQDCVDLPFKSSYFMADFINANTRADAVMFMGVCMPAVCTTSNIKEIIDAFLIVPTYRQLITQQLGYPLAVGAVKLNPQNDTYS